MPGALPARTDSKMKRTKIKRLYQTSATIDCVTDDHMAQLERLKNLHELHMLDATAVTDIGRESLQKLRRLEWVNLDTVSDGDAWLASLPSFKRLCGLQVSRAAVTSVGLEHLRKLRKLEYLALELMSIDDATAAVLAKLKHLRTLRLCSTRITDSGLKHLKSLKKLQTLYVMNSFVTEKGIARLQTALPNCQIEWTPFVVPTILKHQCWYKPPYVPHEGVPRYLNPKWPHYGEPRFVESLDGQPVAKTAGGSGRAQGAAPKRTGRGSRGNRISACNFKFMQPDWIHLLDL